MEPPSTSATENTPLLGPKSPLPSTPTEDDDIDNGSDRLTPPDGPSAARLLLVLSGVYVSAFLVALDSTLVATLASPISTSFSSLSLLSWLASAFFVANAASQPLAGRLTEIYGRRAGMIFANVVFGIGNLMCAMAKSENTMIAGRVVAGLGGGVIGPTAVFIMSDLIPLRRRSMWQGTANICFGIGSSIGGPLGGWIDDQFGWRAAFLIQTPLTLLAIVLSLLFIKVPESSGLAKWKRIDFTGAFLLVATLVAFLLALTTGDWTSPLVLTALPVSVVLGLAFIYFERFHAEPIIPVTLLLNRTILAACLTNWFATMARFGVIFYLPLYFLVQGHSVTATGLCLVPESVAIGITGFAVGLIIRLTGRYYLLNAAVSSVFLLSLAITATLSASTTSWLPFISMFLLGVGYVGQLTTTLLAALAAIDHHHHAVITSASYAFRSTGSTIGIAVANTVLQTRLNDELNRRLGGREGAEEVIRRVQSSIDAIKDLPEEWRIEVVAAYMASLQVVFVVLLGLGVLATICSLLVKEHKLYKTMDRTDEDEDQSISHSIIIK
ncbi:putative MFS multidrug transporter [Mollisia scopiformis]|uniref:Putative MFS multidrug transporter n=1 Tax=Mollisia scopiformis TaxID=149040 RepID=A0A194XQ75_MOLSC|nr:putative MFS multidrug transporter [Mollisia scopiformis]KUJ22311.1 putative MFS multidrug transporter [Mollisia scopiformis]